MSMLPMGGTSAWRGRQGDHFPLCGAAVHFQLCAGDRDGAVQLRKPELNPSYVCAIPASEEWRLGTYDRTHVHWMNLGKCIVYHRSLTREESVRKETFALLLDWMTAHGYHMREK